jgi:uncharacterized damage-inducible protein DinB
MSKVARIEEQLRKSFEGGPWHGPSVREVLADVDARTAAARPIADAHSIWEIVLHLSAWEDVARRRLEGEHIEEPEEGDWPPAPEPSDAAWAATLETLGERQARLQRTAAGLDDARLDDPVWEGASSLYATLLGQIQHRAYHAGQVAVMKKAR